MALPTSIFSEQAESPNIDYNNGTKTIQRIYKCAKSVNVEDYLPEHNSGTEDGYYQGARSYKSDPFYLIVMLNFSSEKDGGFRIVRNNNETKYFPSDNGIDIPLEKHQNYLTFWNWDLYQACKSSDLSTFSSVIPSWWDEATDLSDADGIEYMWSKSHPSDFTNGSDLYRWILVMERRKPGLDSFHTAAPVITEKYYNKSRNKVKTWLKSRQPGTLVTPGDTWDFDTDPVSGETYTWLVMGISVDKEDIYYVGVASLQAANWDGDLY